MATASFVPAQPALRTFLEANPDLRLIDADLYDPRVTGALHFASGDDREEILAAARAHQSLARVSDDPDLVDRLYRAGFDSAAAIATRPLHVLRQKLSAPAGEQRPAGASEAADVSADVLAAVHARAVDVHSRAVHLASQMRGALSPHGRALPSNHLAAQLIGTFGHLPSFAQLFGSQDYIPSPHCQSVIGPAAYFLDLMRVVDEEITSNPANHIEEDNRLAMRREGLFIQDLTCAETLTPVPKIAIINKVISDNLKRKVGTHTDYAIASHVFPYNLPINVRLARIRAAIAALGPTLADLYETFAGREPNLEHMPDALAIAAENLGLSVEQRELVRKARTEDALAACFGGDMALLREPIKRTVTIAKDSLEVKGSGFAGVVVPATILRVEDSLRAVITVVDDQTLKVDQSWPEARTDAEGWLFLPQTLGQAGVLSERTRLDDAAIAALFVEALDQHELDAGLAAKLYINAASNLTRARLIADRTDVSYTLQVVAHLDAARIDRLNRIIRLSQASGVAVADLDWALRASGNADFAPNGLTVVGEAVALARRLSLPLVEAVGLWSVLKTWGRGDGPVPLDLFDRVFNSTAEQDGYYRPLYPDNPLFTDDVDPWTLADGGKKALATRTWLSAALGVSDKDLMQIAATVARGAAELSLDVPTLSSLWAVARLARALAIGVADLVALMRLAKLSRFACPADVRTIIDLKTFLADRSLSLADLAYVVWGEPGDKTDVVRRADVQPFLAALRTFAKDWLVTPANFAGDDDANSGLSIFDTLVYNKAISQTGAVLFRESRLVFAVLTLMFPISAADLVVPDLISRQQALEAYEALDDNGILLGNGLANPVDDSTILSFLFPEVPVRHKREAMIAAVRGVLNKVTQDIELSRAVLVPALRLQDEGTFSQLGTFLGCGADAAKVVVTNVLATRFLNTDPRALLLAEGSHDAQLVEAMVLVGRIIFLARILTLRTVDLTDISASPSAFGVVSLQTLDMTSVTALSNYATLVALYEPKPEDGRNIALYLITGQLEALAKATGWDPSAFIALVKALWRHEIKLTPDRLWQARACFVIAATMGTDVGSCIEVAKLARLPAMTATTPPPAWTSYKECADELVDMLRAKSAGGDWAQSFKPVGDREETARRDGGVALAVWLSSAAPLHIKTPRALSEYLLIDLETSACDVTSPIVEATAAVQTYLQRCRMSLEPGVVSLGDIAPAWWPWLANYRIWEANRKIFLYPESYIDPTLRGDRTDLFRKLQEELQQSNITPASVERAFTNYLTAFADLAKLRTVESTRAFAPHPISGTPVQTVFFLGRTEAKPYQYYYRTLRAGNIWSQWSKIDVAMTSPDASLVFAFNRIFLFWVEEDAVQGSFIKGGSQHDKAIRRANIQYAFQRLDATWSAPQTLETGVLFDAQPTLYSNNVIDPTPGAPSEQGVDPRMPYWRRVFVQLVPAPQEGGERLLITFGNAFRIPPHPDVEPPKPERIDTADERRFVSEVYAMSQVGASFTDKRQGAQLLVPVAYLDIGMNVETVAAFLPDFTGDVNQMPFAFITSRDDLGLGPIKLGPNESRSILIDSAFVDSPDYHERVSAAPEDMITYVASDARVLAVKNQVGWFIFDNGDEAFLMRPKDMPFKPVADILEISKTTVTVKTVPEENGGSKTIQVPCDIIACGRYSYEPVDLPSLKFEFTRLTTGAVARLIQVTTFGSIDALLSIKTQEAKGPASLDFKRFHPHARRVILPATLNGGAVDFNGAYRPYFEEIFFHAPFFIASQLSANQHHEAAKAWYEYIFDPAAVSKGQKPPERNPEAVYWQYLPFRSLVPQSLIDILTDETAIEEWNANPFDPFTVAQLRPVAFEKTIVMHYIANLLDWADSCFARDTRESVNQATLLYLTAADLLGPRPRQRGVYQPPAPLNFEKIKKDYGQLIPQFLIALERVLPAPEPGKLPLEPAPFNMISAYFTVPENAAFITYWDRVETNLYRIRNCLSFAGIPRQLALFEPPIEPGALIRAAGRGRDVPAVIAQGAGSLPHYRFQALLDRARGLTNTTTAFGAALLAALEKRDAEDLQMLRTRQERAILVQTGDMKAELVVEGQDQVESLRQAKLAAQERLTYYTKLLAEGLSPAEVTSMTTMILANVFQTTGSVIRALSGGAHLVPNAGSPFAMTYGGREIGASLGAFAAVADTVAGTLDFASALSGVIAGYQRREQEWSLQQKTAAYEVAQMDAQIAAAEAHVASLKRDVAINTLSIVQNDELQKVLTQRFSNAELYGWLASRLQVMYFQAYKLALDLAMAAQRAFQYELDNDKTYLDFGYWESGRAGLLAGEGLQLALDQLEHAYYSTNRRRLAVDKVVSLWALDPVALLTLRRTGSCNFQLSELLFDYDFPGHYCRKIERLSVTIPAVVGPYQNVHGTLTQTGNVILIAPDPDSARYLLGENVQPNEGALRLNWRSGQQIVLSRGIEDTGTIVDAPTEERYLPFEGTGAISSWRLELPLGSNRIDFSTIADVVITLRYSALAGGATLQKAVLGALSTKFAGQASVALQQRYPDAWARFLKPAEGAPQAMTFMVGPDLLPANLTDQKAKKVYVQFDLTIPFTSELVVELAPAAGPAATLELTQTEPWDAQPVECPLTTAAAWTLTLTTIPPDLAKDRHLKPGALTGVTLILDYTATVKRS
jgi:hypothetical protein